VLERELGAGKPRAAGAPTVVGVGEERRLVTGHLPEGELERELARVTDRRDPPVPVDGWLRLDSRWTAGELHGWRMGSTGAETGRLVGMVTGLREYAPGFWCEYLLWLFTEQLRIRPDD